MTGPKLNEATNKVGVSSGTRAKAMNVRMSASKVRVVLNHIRGKEVKEADDLLSLIQRDSAHDVRKLLASAVANAVNNDNKDANDLFVKACFADEGPTMKRFRPRAKGRAGQILKRSCHITMSDRALAVREQSIEAKGNVKTASRSSRVAASRARTEKPATEEAVETTDTTTESGEEN
jgi:large subunit ribosomal protein L22